MWPVSQDLSYYHGLLVTTQELFSTTQGQFSLCLGTLGATVFLKVSNQVCGVHTSRDNARPPLSLIVLVVWDMKAVPVRPRQASDLDYTQSAIGSQDTLGTWHI